MNSYEERCLLSRKVMYPVCALVLAAVGMYMKVQECCRPLSLFYRRVLRVYRQVACVVQRLVRFMSREIGGRFEFAVWMLVRTMLGPVATSLDWLFDRCMGWCVSIALSILQRPCLVCTVAIVAMPLVVKIEHAERHTTQITIFGMSLAQHTSDRSVWRAAGELLPRRIQLLLAIHTTLSRTQVQSMRQAGSWMPLARRAEHLLQWYPVLVALAASSIIAVWLARRVEFRLGLVSCAQVHVPQSRAQVQAQCQADLTEGESAIHPFPRRETVPTSSQVRAVHALMLMPPPVPHRRRLRECHAEMLEGRL